MVVSSAEEVPMTMGMGVTQVLTAVGTPQGDGRPQLEAVFYTYIGWTLAQ